MTEERFNWTVFSLVALFVIFLGSVARDLLGRWIGSRKRRDDAAMKAHLGRSDWEQ